MKPVTVRQLIKQLIKQDMDAIVQVSDYRGVCFDILKDLETYEYSPGDEIAANFVFINLSEEG